MKKLKILLVAACVAAFCFVLAGCGGGNGGGGNASAEIVGTWEMSGGQSSDGTTYGSEEVAMMKELGMEFSFEFKADGSCTGSMAGESTQGTWKDAGNGAIDITLNGQTQQGKLANGELSITAGNETITFKKAS